MILTLIFLFLLKHCPARCCHETAKVHGRRCQRQSKDRPSAMLLLSSMCDSNKAALIFSFFFPPILTIKMLEQLLYCFLSCLCFPGIIMGGFIKIIEFQELANWKVWSECSSHLFVFYVFHLFCLFNSEQLSARSYSRCTLKQHGPHDRCSLH